MFLNSHERWLLRRVGLNGDARRALISALVRDGRFGGEIDVAAQAPGIKLAKRAVRTDLEPMFDRLMNPVEPSVRKVVYGHRRYRVTTGSLAVGDRASSPASSAP